MSSDAEILDELRKIRELLTPAPAPPPSKGFVAEFRAFLEQYKVLGLAVAFIMGVYLGALVQSLAKDFILPLLGIALGSNGNFSTYTFMFAGQTFGVGDFITALITFAIVAIIIFFIVKVAERYNIR